jgi:putative phosphoesterase
MIAIISDIHGNYHALIAALKEIDEIGCDQIVSLGDVAGYYCMLNECISELRKRKIINLMGNHDHYLVHSEKCPRSNSANVCLNYQQSTILPENREWLATSPTTLRINEISLVHGGWNNPLDEYITTPDKDYFSRLESSVFISGHTHIQRLHYFGEKIYCNPGSIGQPRDGDPRAAYALIDERQIELRRVAYDIDAMVAAMQAAGFEKKIYENLYHGLPIGGIVKRPTS